MKMGRTTSDRFFGLPKKSKIRGYTLTHEKSSTFYNMKRKSTLLTDPKEKLPNIIRSDLLTTFSEQKAKEYTSKLKNLGKIYSQNQV